MHEERKSREKFIFFMLYCTLLLLYCLSVCFFAAGILSNTVIVYCVETVCKSYRPIDNSKIHSIVCMQFEGGILEVHQLKN